MSNEILTLMTSSGGRLLWAALSDIFGKDGSGNSNLLGAYLADPAWIVGDVSTIDSPDDISVNPPWIPVRATAVDAHTLRETAINNTHGLQCQPVNMALGPLALGVEYEPEGRTWMRIRNSIIGAVHFDCTGAGAIGTTTNGTGTIQELTAEGRPGVYRCTAILTGPGSGAAQNFTYALGVDDTFGAYLGDITKGGKFYNPTITQTSVAQWLNLGADQMLAQYGDAFNLVNATKASQPVWSAAGWGGTMGCLTHSAANWLAADAMAAQFTGEDLPLTVGAVVQNTSITGVRTLFALGGSGGARLKRMIINVGNYYTDIYPNLLAGRILTDTTIPADITNKTCILWTCDTLQDFDQNATTLGLNGSAADTSTITLNLVTWGASRYSSTVEFMSGYTRVLLIAKSSLQGDLASQRAVERILQMYAPLA